jgi:RNA polymerase sigma factor (sigma-70 family)
VGDAPLDQELLEAFVVRRDEAAFEALVRRHGPMVLGVCRRVLLNHHDAEDAFQATFLVLARKAASVRPRHLVGNWLHGVAYRTALEARTVRNKRLARQKALAGLPETAAPQTPGTELQRALDEELQHLPDHYRAAIVLCDLEGKTQSEAARQLACPPGTIACRLTRGRDLLAKRLRRHGLALSGAGLVLALAGAEASAAVRTSLVTSTVKAASAVAAGASAGSVVSARVAELSHRMLTNLLFARLKTALALVVAAVVLGASLLALPSLPAEQPAAVPSLPAPPMIEDWGEALEDQAADDVADEEGPVAGPEQTENTPGGISGIGSLPGDAGECNRAMGADLPESHAQNPRPSASPVPRLPGQFPAKRPSPPHSERGPAHNLRFETPPSGNTTVRPGPRP